MKKILIISAVLVFICICIGCFGLFKIYSEKKEIETAEELSGQFSQYSPAKYFDGKITYSQIYQKFMPELKKMQIINPQVIGWIYIPDSNINYPVLQGSDNSFYLTHAVNGEYSAAGSVFVDKRGLESENTVIYGHNMGKYSNVMFHDITNFSDKVWFDTVQTGYLITNDCFYKLNIFSYTLTLPQTPIYGENADMEYIKENAVYYREPSQGRLFNLSTCAYDYANARAVLSCIAEEYSMVSEIE